MFPFFFKPFINTLSQIDEASGIHVWNDFGTI